MSKSASTRAIESYRTQLEAEKASHARTRRELQVEIERVWRLVPSWKIHLMGAYPPLRKLLMVLGEAAELQDPSSGQPMSDTMRSEVTEYSSTERAVLTHKKHRATVAEMNKQLEWLTDRLSRLIPGVSTEYNPPSGECECGCGRLVFQTDTGRSRQFASAACRKRASRKVAVNG